MHGKGGSPNGYVSGLAITLEKHGFLVANLEMPWSDRRDYDVNVDIAEKEVDSALDLLRNKGAQKLFVAGHSLGGGFALCFGSRHVVDGVIAIAPGGNVSTKKNQGRYADSLALARNRIAEGKGDVKIKLMDYEGSRGEYPVIAPPSSYLSWFDPEGLMNQNEALRNMNPAIPVLYISPTNDYPELRKGKQAMFDALPKNPYTKLYEPNSTHKDAPSISANEIIYWVTSVARNEQIKIKNSTGVLQTNHKTP
jgi:pimeloyl-ACP methyl ester carboxylesterase